jgi:hypothetical protein
MKVILSVPDEGYSERTWWRLFQKRVVCTNLDNYTTKKNFCNTYIFFYKFQQIIQMQHSQHYTKIKR